jgi:hypothetical protein
VDANWGFDCNEIEIAFRGQVQTLQAICGEVHDIAILAQPALEKNWQSLFRLR